MKYFLIKQEEFDEINKKFIYVPIKEFDKFSTNSRELMIYDEKSNNIWYSFLFTPDAKLTKIKKEHIQEQLEMISEKRVNDEKDESFHEVPKEIFFQYLNALSKRYKKNGKEDEVDNLKTIKDKIENIVLKYEDLNDFEFNEDDFSIN